MSNKRLDINDDEIRIIAPVNSSSTTGGDPDHKSHPRHKLSTAAITLLVIAACLLAGTIIIYVSRSDKEVAEPNIDVAAEESYLIEMDDIPVLAPKTPLTSTGNGYVEIIDTIVNRVPLAIYTPRDAVPRLSIGVETLKDTSAVMVVQAADIRRDNGQIVGSYVVDGELVSRGQSKSGFCAILSGYTILGVADSTPYLEQAIDSKGYFFRQYPLVVSGQVVGSNLEQRALRKALAHFRGTISVIMSKEPMTMNDFSQSLVDLGVTNAIYLVGSTAYGWARDSNRDIHTFGTRSHRPPHFTNYMVWQ